jgi:hypothetical protein
MQPTLDSIFCHSAFVSQRWNLLVWREKGWKKLESEERGPRSTFLSRFIASVGICFCQINQNVRKNLAPRKMYQLIEATVL